MKEKDLKLKAKSQLASLGFVAWFPPKVKFYQNDIFGVFDLVAVRDTDVYFIQITTKTNLSHRRRKVQEFMREHNCVPVSWVWAYDEKINDFIRERVLPSEN